MHWYNIQTELLQDKINYTYDCLIDPFDFEEQFPDNYADTDELLNNIYEDDDVCEDEFIDEDMLEYEEFLKETSK